MSRARAGFVAGLRLAVGAGCSNQQLYISMQKRGLSDWRQLPGPRYQQCIEAYQRPCDGYRRELEPAREAR